MLKSFTRNYEDNSTEAGFQFTFYCDNCHDGYRSSFIESETYTKGKSLRGLATGASILGGLFGGRMSSIGYSAERATNILSERFEDRSPEWQKEHENAFEQAQNEAYRHFHRCHSCHQYVCDACFNEDEGLCVECAPRQEVYVAKFARRPCSAILKKQGSLPWSGRVKSRAKPPLAPTAENLQARENSAAIAVLLWK